MKKVVLCGSTRFGSTFAEMTLKETLAGNIVLSIGANMRDDQTFKHMPTMEQEFIKASLDVLHYAKIDESEEVFILNVGGYMGDSTRRELAYAMHKNKQIRFYDFVPYDQQEHIIAQAVFFNYRIMTIEEAMNTGMTDED